MVIDRETTWRPSPSGGALHGLELYCLAVGCPGLQRGLYHYDTSEHVLRPIDVHPSGCQKLLKDAVKAQGNPASPPGVVLLVAARFQRVSWKYEGVAYSLILKDLGALYQTMYLVVTAMGLATCAIGTRNSYVFARLVGLDPEVESTVGEFTLR